MNRFQWAAVAICLSAVILHAIVLMHTTGATYDIRSYSIQAHALLAGRNVYTQTTRYPYPPVWIYIIAACSLIAQSTHTSFSFWARLPACLGDIGILLALLWYGFRSFGDRRGALLAASLYAFNPIPLLISAGHGQFDSLVILCVLLGAFLVSQHPRMALLFLGCGIALKGYPVLLAPMFMLRMPRHQRSLALLLIFGPLVAAVGLYAALFGWTMDIVSHVLGYQGVPIMGWLALIGGGRTPAVVVHALQALVIVFVLWFSWKSRTHDPIYVITIIFLGFYAIGFDLSVQYFIWVLPFIMVVAPRWGLIYSLVTTWSLLVVYAAHFPGVIPFPSAELVPQQLGLFWLATILPTIFALFSLYIAWRSKWLFRRVCF